MHVRKIPLDENLWLYNEPELYTNISPDQAMDLACSVALKGVGGVHKNPLVGAVLVDKDHRFLAAAAHLIFGQEHAEINLIEQIRRRKLEDRLQDATLYTSLEPCSHSGKTQACVEALYKLPLKQIVYGAVDPNPLVAGRGIRQLERRGFACYFSSDFAEKSKHLLEHFRWNLNSKTPFTAIKAALTLNGMAAYPGDQRSWITGERARAYAHWLRLSYEGILVGAETVILDNPTLSMRHPYLKGPTPLRIVLDPKGRALLSRPLSEHRLLSEQVVKTLWLCGEDFWKHNASVLSQLENLGAQTFSLPNGWDLQSLLQTLKETKDLASLLIEGGPTLWGSFLKEGLVQKSYIFLAPKFFSHNAINFSKSLLPDQNVDLEFKTLSSLEDDLLIEASVRN